MANPEPSKAQANPAIIIFAAIGLFLVVIASLAAYLLWPRGQRVATIDLTAATPSSSVELRAGDMLSFHLDATVGTAHGYPDSSRSRSNAVLDQLEQSVVTVALARDGQVEATTRCGAYDGKATTGSSTSTEVTSSGLPLRCMLRAREPGKHTLTVSVAWTPEDVRKARLEVYRQRADD